jgi:hypothetical protein
LVGALEGAHRVLLIAGVRDDAAAPWHLEDVVTMVSCCHELGEGWIPEDGVVREADVGDVKVNELGVVVVALAEGDWEAYLPQGVAEPLTTPEKGLVGKSWSYGTWSRSKVSTERTFRPAAPSMRVLVTATLLMVGVHSMGRTPAAIMVSGSAPRSGGGGGAP